MRKKEKSPCCNAPMDVEGMVDDGFVLWRCDCGNSYVEDENGSLIPPDLFKEMRT